MIKFKNYFLKFIFIYSLFANILSIFFTFIINNNISFIMYKSIKYFIVIPLLISIPILFLYYKFFKIQDEIINNSNEIYVVNDKFKNRFSLKDICAITIINNIIFIFNINFSLFIFIFEIIVILFYINFDKLRKYKSFNILSNFIKNKFIYILFFIIFIFSIFAIYIFIQFNTYTGDNIELPIAVFYSFAILNAIISIPILLILSKIFNKKYISFNYLKSNNIDFIIYHICNLLIINNYLLQYKNFNVLMFLLLDILFITMYILNIIFKFTNKYPLFISITKIFIWFILFNYMYKLLTFLPDIIIDLNFIKILYIN